MKKKLVVMFTMLLAGVSLLSGCGKTEEEKVRDEIMSHMDADEKANIAADQQAIADYEAEKQAKEEAIANETPINYAEVLEERTLGSISFRDNQQPFMELNVLMPADEYIYAGDDHKTHNGQYFFGQNRANIGMYFFVANGSVADGMPVVGQYGDYTVFYFTDGFGGAIFVGDGSGMVIKIECKITTNEDDLPMALEVAQKNLDYIVEQLGNGVISDDTEEEALGDAEPEIFGSYSGNSIDITIGLGNESFEITITGAEEFNGPLSWLADDMYDCRVDETWLQVQLIDSNTITIRSSNLPLEGTYIRN